MYCQNLFSENSFNNSLSPKETICIYCQNLINLFSENRQFMQTVPCEDNLYVMSKPIFFETRKIFQNAVC